MQICRSGPVDLWIWPWLAVYLTIFLLAYMAPSLSISPSLYYWSDVLPVNTVKCATPSTPSDSAPVSSLQSSYSVGDTVAFRCNNGISSTTRYKTCLTSGSWSSMNYVCSGWSYFKISMLVIYPYFYSWNLFTCFF